MYQLDFFYLHTTIGEAHKIEEGDAFDSVLQLFPKRQGLHARRQNKSQDRPAVRTDDPFPAKRKSDPMKISKLLFIQDLLVAECRDRGSLAYEVDGFFSDAFLEETKSMRNILFIAFLQSDKVFPLIERHRVDLSPAVIDENIHRR